MNDTLRILLISSGILLGAIFLSRLMRWLMNRSIRKAAKKLKFDPTNYNFIKNAVSAIIFIIAAVMIFRTIPGLEKVGTSVLAGAGIIAAALAFASQQALANIISGMFIVAFRPFSVGDFIKIGDLHLGTVEDITLRHTVIRNPENRRVIIPNSIISSETILNSTITDERVCMFIEVGISYYANIDYAIQLLQEEAMKHAHFLDNRTQEEKDAGKPPVIVRVLNLGQYSIDLRAYVWAENPGKGWDLKTDLLKSIKERFDKEGVEIPFPYQNIILKNTPNNTQALK